MPEEIQEQEQQQQLVEEAPPDASSQVMSELDAIKKRLESVLQTAPTPKPSSPPPGTPDPQQLEKAFWDNPLGMTSAIAQRAAQEATQGLLMQFSDTLSLAAREQARRMCKHPELFDKYTTEIDAKMMQLPPQFRLRADVWLNAANATFGEHIHEIKELPEPRVPAIRVKGPSPPSPPPPPAPKEEPLTEDERFVCKRLGITEEQYRKGKEWVRNQSPVGPSSWDEFVTFDSFEKRRRERAST